MPASRNPAVWFEIPVHDLDRARSFYEHILEVELNPQQMGLLRMAWFPMVAGGAGATGCLIQADGYVPGHQGTLIYLSVEDIDLTLTRVRERGGRVINPRLSIGEFGFVAHFEDLEGNRIALHSDG